MMGTLSRGGFFSGPTIAGDRVPAARKFLCMPSQRVPYLVFNILTREHALFSYASVSVPPYDPSAPRNRPLAVPHMNILVIHRAVYKPPVACALVRNYHVPQKIDTANGI